MLSSIIYNLDNIKNNGEKLEVTLILFPKKEKDGSGGNSRSHSRYVSMSADSLIAKKAGKRPGCWYGGIVLGSGCNREKDSCWRMANCGHHPFDQAVPLMGLN